MFCPKTGIVSFFALFVMFFSSCATPTILGLRQQKAAELLHQGDLGFITQAELPEDFSQAVSQLNALSRIHPAASYYAAILVGAQREPHDQSRRLEKLLFSAALESPSLPARREAALRLMRLILEAEEIREVHDMLGFLANGNIRERGDVILLRAACLYRLGRYDEAARLLPANPADGWEKALALLASWRASGGHVSEARRQEITAFLFDLPAGDLRRWAYSQALDNDGLLDSGEHGLIFIRRFPAGHMATLSNLRPALLDGGLLFFRSPALIVDLARAYQLTPAMRGEGVSLFTAWDSLLETRTLPPAFGTGSAANYYELQSFVRTLDSEAINARRFLMLQAAGRIERARGHLPASSELFWRAIEFAPSAAQSDSCLWYILMNTIVHDPSNATAVFLSTMPRWNNMTAFNAVIDRLSQYLVAERQWETLLEVFNALENSAAAGTRPGASLAQFAWITGRAVQEGFLAAERSAESFFRVAFEQPNASVYYRTMAALKLGENFSPVESATHGARPPTPPNEDGELEFLLGFFEHGAASFAQSYIRALEHKLSIPQLREVSDALGAAGDWMESIRVAFRYTQRDYFVRSREDLYCSHPRPFLDLVERYAREMNLRPEMMLGLIRTESLFGPYAVSHAGAVGLAQFMPTTAEYIADRIIRAGGPNLRGPGGLILTDPRVSIHLGSFYMRHLISSQMEGSIMLALQAYNGGQGRVRRWLDADREWPDGGLPLDLFLEAIPIPETRNYGRFVLAAAAIYGYLYYGTTMEEVAASIWQ